MATLRAALAIALQMPVPYATRARPFFAERINHIERFYNTLRQRVSRLVRKTLSFSKKLENHIGAIWNFIHHYNLVISSESMGAAFTPHVAMPLRLCPSGLSHKHGTSKRL